MRKRRLSLKKRLQTELIALTSGNKCRGVKNLDEFENK